jgi:hypothetical protein
MEERRFGGEGYTKGSPALYINSWYDLSIGPNVAMFQYQTANAANELARNNVFMVIAPTPHCQQGRIETEHTIVGERDVGDARFDYVGLIQSWYDHFLKGTVNGVTNQPKVRAYMMGANKWRTYETWPPRRLRMAESLFGAADDPDLRKFKRAGGKMILYQGGADESDIPSDSVDYYETVGKLMGGRAATQNFFRLFVVPGMNHCTGGAGAFAIDYLTYLEAWVEKGTAPDVLIESHVADISYTAAHYLTFPVNGEGNVTFTRPVYPYPILAKYKGSGDPNDAANFRAVGSP